MTAAAAGIGGNMPFKTLIKVGIVYRHRILAEAISIPFAAAVMRIRRQ